VRYRSLFMLWLLFLIPSPAHAAGYVVRPGDSLTAIAARYHTSVQSLASANGIRNANLIPIGSLLRVPDQSGSSNGFYRVRWGDTLSGISARFGVSIAQIRALNRLGTVLLAGSRLRLCSACGAVGTSYWSAAAISSGASTSRYAVQPGDSLSAIAVRFGVSATTLMSLNGISNPNRIFVGSLLTLPSGASLRAASSGYDPVAARSLITAWSQTYGLDPTFALALAWLESGFNQQLVSSTGAIGVMQVEPATALVISDLLGRSLSLYNTDDNIHAGVFWLAHLVAYYGGDEQTAAAAYYQGTKSIARFGFYSDTFQYVNNVMALKARFGG
jgi:LysM repeat protein